MSSRILDMLREHKPGYHPLVSILNLSDDSDGDKRLELDCHKTIAKYVEAERKAIEVKNDESGLIKLKIDIGGDEDD